MPSRGLPTLWAGMLAYTIARACDVPIWMDNRTGDATDIGMVTACLTFTLLGFVRTLAIRDTGAGERRP